MAAFLKAQCYSSRKTAAELVARLRSAAAGRAGEVETHARRSVVARLVATLQVMVGQISELEAEISQALDAHPDGEIFRSFFRGRESVVCAATSASTGPITSSSPAPSRWSARTTKPRRDGALDPGWPRVCRGQPFRCVQPLS
jgi:hypothetical protein